MVKNNEEATRMHGWPKAEKLKLAIEVILEFQALCRHQLDLGYWATVDFPSKHHFNRILSLQYMDEVTAERLYGRHLAKRAQRLLPLCKSYLDFARFEESKK
jgi:hypothetical protein